MTASYRLYGWWKSLISVQAGFFALVGIVLLAATIRSGSTGQLAFVTVWLAVVVFNLYRMFERIGTALILRDGVLTWIPPSGHAVAKPLTRLQSVRPSVASSVSVLTFSDGTELRVWVRKGFSTFVALLAQGPLSDEEAERLAREELLAARREAT